MGFSFPPVPFSFGWRCGTFVDMDWIFKKSIPVTIVTAVIAATILCQALSAAFSFRPVLFIVFGVAAILTMSAVSCMFYQVVKMVV